MDCLSTRQGFKRQDVCTLKAFGELAEESFVEDHVLDEAGPTHIPSTYNKQLTTFPPFHINKSIDIFFQKVTKDIENTFLCQLMPHNLNRKQL